MVYRNLKIPAGRPSLQAIIILGILMAWAGWANAGDHGAQGGSPVILTDVVVKEENLAEYIRKNPSQVVIMNAGEIRERNFLQVEEALGTMPGVDVKQGSGGLGAKISIRGGGGSGAVLILIDGRPANTLQFGGVDLGSIPIDTVKKITVFKPPVPVWLGPGSSAGAVSIETRQGRAGSRARQKWKIRGTAGSFGLASLSTTGQITTEKTRYMVAAGLSHKDGKRTNAQKDQAHLSLNYARKNGLSDLKINAKAYISDHGVSGPTYNPTPDARQRYEKASLDLKFSQVPTGGMDYTIKTYLDMKQLDETSQNGSESTLDTLTAGLGTDFFITPENEKTEARAGTLVEHSRVDHTLTGEHDRTLLSLHGETHLRTAPFIYTLGLRSDYTNDFHLSPGGHAGISFEASKNTLFKANLGYSENIPSFGQLYQPSHGSLDQVRGNPDLEKEKIISFNLGATHHLPKKFKFSLSVFRTQTRDLIKYVRGEDLINRPVNIDRAYKQGIETGLKFTMTGRTDLDINYILQETRNKEMDKRLSYAPTHTLKLIFKTKFDTGTTLEWTTRGYSEQFSDLENTRDEKLDPYLTCDLKLLHPLKIRRKKLLAFAHFYNIFDTSYASHFGYPNDGFKMELGMSMDF